MSTQPPTNSPFKITPDRKLVSTMGATLTAVTAIVVGTWYVRGFAEDLNRSIKDLSSEVQSLRKEVQDQGKRAWLWDEHTRWVGQLRWEFRKSEYVIPEPRDFRSSP